MDQEAHTGNIQFSPSDLETQYNHNQNHSKLLYGNEQADQKMYMEIGRNRKAKTIL